MITLRGVWITTKERVSKLEWGYSEVLGRMIFKLMLGDEWELIKKKKLYKLWKLLLIFEKAASEEKENEKK